MNHSLVSLLGDTSSSNPLILIFVFMGISILPILFLAVSSFVKISVVLNIFRNAIGAGQIPSGAIVGVLSIALTLHIMTPVVLGMSDILQRKTSLMQEVDFKKAELKGTVNDGYLRLLSYIDFVKDVLQPLYVFLRKYAHLNEREFFADYRRYKSVNELDPISPSKEIQDVDDLTLCADLAGGGERTGPNCSFKGETLASLISAFLISELKQAFLIGFAIYIPFLVLDLVVANILVGMGMSMLNPVTVALPFKLILFVMTDGWYLLSRGLVLSYN